MVLIYESDLIWSTRLRNSLKALGYDSRVVATSDIPAEGAECAIVNLGSSKLNPSELVPKLRSAGIPVVGHAGHKEKHLQQLGNEIGCNVLATNSEVAHKLDEVIRKATSR